MNEVEFRQFLDIECKLFRIEQGEVLRIDKDEVRFLVDQIRKTLFKKMHARKNLMEALQSLEKKHPILLKKIVSELLPTIDLKDIYEKAP